MKKPLWKGVLSGKPLRKKKEMGQPRKGYHKARATSTTDICKNYHKGNENSVAAYSTESTAKIRAKVFQEIQRRKLKGATCDEVERAIELSHQCCSARCTELKARGLVFEHGGRLTRYGRRAAVLVASEFRAKVKA